MTFYEKVTGADLNKSYKEFIDRIEKLPIDYQNAWNTINNKISKYSDFSGRNLIPLLESVLELLEDMNEEDKTINEIFGDDIDGFCDDLTKDMISNDVRDKWRNKLNKKIEKKIKK